MATLVKSAFVFGFCSLWILCHLNSASSGRVQRREWQIPCPIPNPIPNGSYRFRRNNTIMRVVCAAGYKLQGDRTVECVHGKWRGVRASCATSGCHIEDPNPEHGHILMDKDVRMVLFCLDEYALAGNRFAYCNGTHWDRKIGNCREPSYTSDHECDFETEDICGWTAAETVGAHWRRALPVNDYQSYHTGPRFDHTTLLAVDGHYMLMETIAPSAQPALLLSPIYERDLSLKTACCFRFYYFMYGMGVGDLKVFVRPIKKRVNDVLAQEHEYLRFEKSGYQNENWNEGHFKISELDDDFQIIFVATAGHEHLSDIAIDDVKLMTGAECRALDKSYDDNDSEEAEETTAAQVLVDTQSCRGRCLEQSGVGVVRIFGQLYGRCNCHPECEEDETCCPDFRSVCVNEMFDQSTQSSEDTTFVETTQTTMPTTRRTTTTTPRPTVATKKTTSTTTTTTTRATTTTARPKPTTTTTTTTTTRRPTTSTTKRSTTTKATTKSTILKPTTQATNLWTKNTTTTTKPTIISRASTEAASVRTTSSSTTTTKPQTRKKTPLEGPKARKSKSGKHEILSESIENSSREFKSPAKGILLGALALLFITILIGTVYHHYKEEITSCFTNFTHGEGSGSGSGDVETTSIRAKFLAKTNRLSTSSKIIRMKSKLGLSANRGSDSLNCLVDGDNDFDNDGSLHVDNPLPMNTARMEKSSRSTNL